MDPGGSRTSQDCHLPTNLPHHQLHRLRHGAGLWVLPWAETAGAGISDGGRPGPEAVAVVAAAAEAARLLAQGVADVGAAVPEALQMMMMMIVGH